MWNLYIEPQRQRCCSVQSEHEDFICEICFPRGFYIIVQNAMDTLEPLVDHHRSVPLYFVSVGWWCRAWAAAVRWLIFLTWGAVAPNTAENWSHFLSLIGNLIFSFFFTYIKKNNNNKVTTDNSPTVKLRNSLNFAH